ncbi:IucA/IucC family protein [Elstera litoralis]|uniref:IucA/IucC family protein n=1 Tax=Elstera litoralis TaxID=552518 RepID=UPI0022B702D3|nr:IucA/IucC family C-terminal-domain containing protein [Elstera litoralis]
MRALGPGGPLYTATSSVRTVYSAASPWMLKFSLPVRITNSVRVNRRHELEAGVTMAKLIGALGPALHTGLRFILDPAYMTITLPGRAESGFEVILRENPFTAGRDAGVMTVAALTADPLPGQSSRLETLVRRVAQMGDQSPAMAAQGWFRAYLACALVPLVQLYDAHGIALEAHQQNSLLEVSAGLPQAFYYRDNQGYYLSERYRAYLRRYIPESDNIRALYYDEAEINKRFSYYLIVNQIFSVIARLDKDGLSPEAGLLAELRACLEALLPQLRGAGQGFVTDLLARPTLGAKFNLTTRLFDIDELDVADEGALYAHFPNPLAPPTGASVAPYALPS